MKRNRLISIILCFGLLSSMLGAPITRVAPVMAAGVHRTDALVLVNSNSASYADFAHFIQPYLDHFGIPYTILDIATEAVPVADIGDYAVIIIGHREIDIANTYLDATEQEAITLAVSAGTGLVNFDNELSSDGVGGRYGFVDDIFIYSYTPGASAGGVDFPLTPLHYITSAHTPESSISTGSMTLVDVTAPWDITPIATSGNLLFLGITTHDSGRAVQWGSYDWMSHAVKGPLFGLDDLVWRSIVWAARKPFVMQGMPPFVTMRMDDVSGPLWWMQTASDYGFIPWAGILTNDIDATESVQLKNLVDNSKATTSIHTFDIDNFFYFNHNSGTNFADLTMAANYTAATQWFNDREIPISKYLAPHYYEIGSNAFDGLQTWGVEFLSAMMDPGQLESTAPWMNAGPFRLFENGTAYDRSHNPYYADYMTIPGHPEYNGEFFNCVTEIRDVTGYEWLGNGRTSVAVATADGIEWLKRPLDSMTLATLFSHENSFISVINQADLDSIMQGITAGIASYDPMYVSMDYACQYLRAIHDSNISNGQYDSDLKQITTNFSGNTDMPTKFYIFYEDAGEIKDYLIDVPTGSTQVVFTLPGPLDHIQVTPNPATVTVGLTQQFSAQGYDAGNNPIPGLTYTWSVVNGGGTINPSGLFTAGINPGEYTDTVVASRGSVQGTATVTVEPTTLDHFTFDLVGSPKYAGVPFEVTIRALDQNEIPVVTYAGTADLSVSASSITPSTTGAFTEGVWTGAVTIEGFASDVFITATDDAFTGSSNTFDVQELVFPHSIWDNTAVPQYPDEDDNRPLEVGVKFRSDIAGYITGIRFYKGILNTETHIGHLWSSTGNLLASAPFSGETETGWQEVYFDQPVPIAANTTYVASYFSPSGGHSYTDYGFLTSVYNPPLRALADGEDGPNGVYRHDSSGFPTEYWEGHAPNYWVDVLFDVSVEPDITPPQVISTIPADGASGVNTIVNILALFTEGMDSSTISGSTVELYDDTLALVPSSVTYNALARSITIDPTSNLAYSTVYTARIKGGVDGVADLSGNHLAADYTWSFTTSAPPLPPGDEGPGGPILVVADAGNPFGRYYAEILRTEGLNEFTVTDISFVDATVLADHDVVILAEQAQSLTQAQVTLFTDWVTGGGNLIAMRPDPLLVSLLGLAGPSGTLGEGYVLVNAAQAPGTGIVNQTIQFHGVADLYSLDGATSIATLYSDATTATTSPAVTLLSVGSNGGQAAAFTYDLAKSVVYTHQGNPAWAGQERDGITPIRPNDLFYGGGSELDWIDLDKVAIPQADEQQRLLANMILYMNQDQLPLPRFWYFPRGEKAVVIMTADDHGNGDVTGRFDRLLARSPTGCSVDDWDCLRSSAFIYTSSNINDAQAAAYTNIGFEIGLHVNTGCADFTPTSLANDYTVQLGAFDATFPSIPRQASERTHCIAWSDWASQPIVKFDHNIRLDTNYYYWSGEWIGDRPGFFTGSGMPMRFADLDGTMLDVYQATTQMTDESLQTYPYTIDTLLDRALGIEGYYGVFTANIHSDGGADLPGSEAILTSALARSVPVVSGRQMANWLDGRNGSAFKNIAWSEIYKTLSFDIEVEAGANGLQAMAPAHVMVATVSGITLGGVPVSYTRQTIKGIEYAIFNASAGSVVVSYSEDETPPTVTSVSPIEGATDVPINSEVSVTFSEPVDPDTITATTFELRDAGNNLVDAVVTYNSGTNTAILTPDTPLNFNAQYTAKVIGGLAGVKDLDGSALANDYIWSFTTAPDQCPCSIWEVSDLPASTPVNDGSPIEVGTKFRSNTAGYITSLLFYKGVGDTDTHVGHLWTAGGAQLAEVTFTNETASGWQEMALPAPIAISPNTTYVASIYSTPVGYFSITADYFLSAHENLPLVALASGTDGPNGVFLYGPPSAFPTLGSDKNYWVDVVFVFNLTPDTTSPIITNLQAIPHGDGTATVTWTTDEPADSLVDYGTSADNLNLTASASALVTAHSLTLTGLAPSTTYYYRVTSADAASNSTIEPLPPASPASFTTPYLSLTDTTVGNFSSGNLGTCYLAQTGNGELILSPTAGTEFDGTSLPGGWSGSLWPGGGTYTVQDGMLTLDGARARYETTYSPGISLEAVATFNAQAFQHVGFGGGDDTFNEAPIIIFSTRGTTDRLFATIYTGTIDDYEIPGSSAFIGSSHHYRIHWKTDGVEFYVDGALVRSASDVIAGPMRMAASDYTVAGANLAVDWMRLSPYLPPCTFTSRIFDAGVAVDWSRITWVSQLPSGTSLAMSVRTGDTPVPDGTWSAFAPIASSGDLINRTSRYLQYQSLLNTTDTTLTPVLESVTITANEHPTAVAISAFTARKPGSEILIDWTTANELDIISFNLYRSQTNDTTTADTLTQSPILARSPGSLEGNSYRFVDTKIEASTTYYYWLEVITRSGATTILGPASAGGYTVFVPMIIR